MKASRSSALPPAPQAQPLRDEHLELVPLGPRDLDDYASLRADPRTRVHSRTRAPIERTEAAAELERSNAAWHEHDFGTWCIREPDGTFVGVIVAVPALADPAVPDVGWVLTPEHWGRGLATAAARLVVDDLFERAKVKRITAHLRSENEASRRVAVKLGMTLAETLDDHDGSVELYELRSKD